MFRYHLIIFDLDGTLIDTSKGIFNSVRYTEKKMGFLPVDAEKLRFFAGPPPTAMYKKVYGLDDASAQMAAFYHREYGSAKAVYEAVPYRNIDILLTSSKYCFKPHISSTLRHSLWEIKTILVCQI